MNKLVEKLVDNGYLSEETANTISSRFKSNSLSQTAQILIKEQQAPEADILSALAEEYDCEFLTNIDPSFINSELVEEIPIDFAKSHQILPIQLGDSIAVLTTDPAEVLQNSQLSIILKTNPEPILASAQLVEKAIQECYFSSTNTGASFLDQYNETTTEESVSDENELLRLGDAAPATLFVNHMLLDAIKEEASDIHVEPFGKTLKVRFRIDGRLYEHTRPPKEIEAALVSRLKIMAKLDISEKRLPQDGMLKVKTGDIDIDVRVSTVPVAEGERVVLRILRHDRGLIPLKQLGMRDETLAKFATLCDQPHGIIWVTGPTGSGKTTTLYAAMREIDTKHKNIMTIEEPVEYQVPDIGQISVRPKIGMGFAQGLRHILRQDPDVILVGETRDLETAEIVVQASLTGHLVFSTLHTNDALGAVVRLVDLGVAPYLVAESTRACLAQRLVRKLCPHCKTAELAKDLEGPTSVLNGETIYRPAGCTQCREGFSGRVGLFELVLLSDELRNKIRQGENLSEEDAINNSVSNLVDEGITAIRSGITSLDEVQQTLGI